MIMWGFYSEMAATRVYRNRGPQGRNPTINYPLAEDTVIDGEVVRKGTGVLVTMVTDDPEGRHYLWDDKVWVGRVFVDPTWSDVVIAGNEVTSHM